MRYLLWVLKIILFVILLSFSLQNTTVITLHAFFGYRWQAPLIFIMLACFIVGAISGILASLTYTMKLRRELVASRKALKMHTTSEAIADDPILTPPRDAL